MRLLIIDDDKPHGESLADLLNSSGHEAYFASSLDDAQWLLELFRFNIALVDYDMPVLDGPEVARRLQEHDPELRAEALYNAGTDALAAGDPARAVEQLREALALEPDRLDTLRNLEYAVRMMEQAPPQQSEDSQDGEDGEQDEQQQQQQDGQQDQQDSSGEQSQEQQQQHQEQDAGEEDSETDQQESPQPEESEEPAEEEPQPQEGEQADQEEISRERALSILKGLDRDEEELRRSQQKRLKGQEAASGKRW